MNKATKTVLIDKYHELRKYIKSLREIKKNYYINGFDGYNFYEILDDLEHIESRFLYDVIEYNN